MKKLLQALTVVLACCTVNLRASADPCKPDSSSQDIISKKQVDRWEQVLTSSGVLSAALMDNDFAVLAIVERYGDTNKISIQIKKKEQSLARAEFESKYHAVKGDSFIFGFKSGDPLTFVAAEVSNQSKAGGVLENLSAPVLVTTVVLSAIVPDKDLATFRAALTSKQIDAVRIALTSGQIDISVKDWNGQRLMEKFGCFYRYLDKRGLQTTQQLDSDHLRTLLSSALNQQLLGDTVMGRMAWPMRVQLVSFDKSTGQVIGQLEWPTLNSIHKIVGNVVGNKLIFRETEFIKKGKAALNCEYTMTASSLTTLDGIVACPESGEIHLVLK